MADDPIYINLRELTGVDDETFAEADRGNRQAQKVMLRTMLTREASAAALTTRDWMHWTLRGIATGSQKAMADALGSIAEAGRNGRLTAAQTDALNKMYEQYFGPGEVGQAASNVALAAFAGNRQGLAVVQLFLLADRLASGETHATIAQIDEGIKTAESLRSDGVKAFLTAVKAQYLAQQAPSLAVDAAMASIRIFSELAKTDDIYQVKLGQTVYLAAQITEIAGEPQAGTLLRMVHADAVEAFLASQRE